MAKNWNINYKLNIVSLSILLFGFAIVLSSCKDSKIYSYWRGYKFHTFHKCRVHAVENANNFAVKKGKDLNLYTVVPGVLSRTVYNEHNESNEYLYIYYISKKGIGDDFVVELLAEACQARFYDGKKLKPDVPKIAEIANKFVENSGIDLRLYEVPQISKSGRGGNWWFIIYWKKKGNYLESLNVTIDTQTYQGEFVIGM